MYLFPPFIVQDFEKLLKVTRAHQFRAQNGPFSYKPDFFGKTINMISICLLGCFFVQNFKKILIKVDPEL